MQEYYFRAARDKVVPAAFRSWTATPEACERALMNALAPDAEPFQRCRTTAACLYPDCDGGLVQCVTVSAAQGEAAEVPFSAPHFFSMILGNDYLAPSGVCVRSTPEGLKRCPRGPLPQTTAAAPNITMAGLVSLCAEMQVALTASSFREISMLQRHGFCG